MTVLEDDQAYFDLQNRNIAFWKKFDNSIAGLVPEVTNGRLEHGNGRFGIYKNRVLVGMVGYSTKGHPLEAEIGVMLDKHATGFGYATAAIKSLTQYAKQHFERVYAEVKVGNDDSIQLLNRAGYRTNGEVVMRDWAETPVEALVFQAPG